MEESGVILKRVALLDPKKIALHVGFVAVRTDSTMRII